MTPIRPGQPTPRPGTGPDTRAEESTPKEGKVKSVKPQEDEHLHPEEMSRKKVESEMPADPDMDDPVSP